MEAYTTSPELINLGAAPAVPALRWSLDARLAMSRRQCAAPVKHRGRARRHRREVISRQLLAFAGGTPVAGAELRTGDGRAVTLHELLHAPIPNAPRWALALRMQGRALLDLVVRHGPASGWGLPQPTTAAETAARWTPYYVPKKSERCWRWWRLAALFLAKVLRTLARAWWQLVPLHRPAPGGTTAGKRGGVLLAPQLVEPPGCRDQTPVSLRALLDRLGSRFAM
jgi:hypothetical protein